MAVQEVCHCLLLTLVLLCFSPGANCSHRLWTRQAMNESGLCRPTPANFSQSFLSACTMLPMNDTVCNRAWSAFSSSFAGKAPETVMASNYRGYFDELPIEAGHSESLFWSGTRELVEMVACMCPAGANVVSSANTPSSQIINEIGSVNWCGTTSNSSSDGIDYTNQCLCSVTTAFWAQFSTEFALAASGSAFYLGYGEKSGGTFQETSFFALHELPNLRPPRVTDVVVMVVHSKGRGESCGEGSLVKLQQKIAKQNLKYSCYDVFGDPMDMSQVGNLSACASRIIKAVQQSTLPEPDDCFSMMMGGSGTCTTLPHVLAMVSVLLFAVILPM